MECYFVHLMWMDEKTGASAVNISALRPLPKLWNPLDTAKHHCCKLCGRELSFTQGSLQKHLSSNHELTIREYYARHVMKKTYNLAELQTVGVG